MNIKSKITLNDIYKIFASREEKETYLTNLFKEKNISESLPKTIKALNEEIINTWDYEISKNIIREMFKYTEKYKIGMTSDIYLNEMLEEWHKMGFGELSWPFSAMNFDQYVQGINTRDISELEKDQIVTKDIIRFRRVKRINTFRNDFIEYLIVENNTNVTPTLKHNRGLDFYINGYPYDQKVSKSVTKEFKKVYGDNWKTAAIEHPEIVAEYLYKYQDAQRFGSESRLLVVYLDENVTVDDIVRCVKNANLKEPMQINFTYELKNEVANYSTECYVIMLYSE